MPKGTETRCWQPELPPQQVDRGMETSVGVLWDITAAGFACDPDEVYVTGC